MSILALTLAAGLALPTPSVLEMFGVPACPTEDDTIVLFETDMAVAAEGCIALGGLGFITPMYVTEAKGVTVLIVKIELPNGEVYHSLMPTEYMWEIFDQREGEST